MKEDLERRESGAFKRKHDDAQAEEEFAQELARLAQDGKRRRKEREESLRQDALLERMKPMSSTEVDGGSTTQHSGHVDELDRSVTLRFPQTSQTSDIDKDEILSRFSRFGDIEEVIIRSQRIKVEGEKRKIPCTTVMLLFKSVVGAHAAVTDFESAAKTEPRLQIFDAVAWAKGEEPDFISRGSTREAFSQSTTNEIPPSSSSASTPSTGHRGDLRSVPSFGSFKGISKAPGSPSLAELTRIRLKNAEKRRLEDKLRQEEAKSEEG